MLCTGLIHTYMTQKWVSGTRGPSQICTDLTDPANGPNGSIRIGNLRTQDICQLRIQPKNAT